ncbi:hypothetical protein PHJA_002032800 [Phtheirospermum japonicum]|uniref:Uncharacterized protein n=1 Tax=Phtheirospermum japonicum TaxID=374723 RepID=A0A830CIQ5_9LAMI|nr:hypothetical protein PHJA_002032800 [Phtheirospermum japonicum]
MTLVSAFSISRPNFTFHPSSYPSSALSPLQFQVPSIKFQTQFKNSSISCNSSVVKFNKHGKLGLTTVRAVAEEEETLVPEEETPPSPAAAISDQTVSVAVSPSDVLTMFFQAEGTMTESAIPAVTKALEGVEGISDLQVQLLEGIGTVEILVKKQTLRGKIENELTKQTTVQATGVASNLVETIQGSGFKLQTLNLSFQDEEDFA